MSLPSDTSDRQQGIHRILVTHEDHRVASPTAEIPSERYAPSIRNWGKDSAASYRFHAPQVVSPAGHCRSLPENHRRDRRMSKRSPP